MRKHVYHTIFFNQVHLRFLIVTNVTSLGNKTNDKMKDIYKMKDN